MEEINKSRKEINESRKEINESRKEINKSRNESIRENQNLINFLESYRVSKGSEFNYTSILNPTGSFNIPDTELTKFYRLYDKAITCNVPLFLTEKPLFDGSPIKLDIDLKSKSKNRLYSSDTIKKLIKFYYQELSKEKTFKMSKKTNFICVVTEKNNPTKSGEYMKDGFHLLFPKTIINYKGQEYLRSKVLSSFDSIFNDCTFENPKEEIVDISVIRRNNWNLYMSKSKPEGLPYKITKIYIINTECKLVKLSDMKQLIKGSTTKFMSIRNDKINVKNLKENLQNEKEEDFQENEFRGVEEFQEDYDEFVVNLINLLDYSRCVDYHKWIRVGWCLHNININLLGLWIDFSSKCQNKFNIRVCKEVWHTAKSGFTIATLHYWAKEDNYEGYMSLISEKNKSRAMNMEMTHTDVSEICYNFFKYNILYFFGYPENRRGWYYFTGHRWKQQTDGYIIRNKFSDDISKLYDKISRELQYKSQNAQTDLEAKIYDMKVKTAKKVSKDLRNRSYKATLEDECKDVFRDDLFGDLADCNPYLIHFNNGVYDLQTETFREGIPEDYITLSTKLDYINIPEVKKTKEYKELVKFLSEILPDKAIRKYVLLVCASCLDYINKEEKFYIFEGKGRNGKSKLVELLQSILGEYTCNLPITLITRKRGDSGSATPELAKIRYKRMCLFKEPDGLTDAVLNMGLIKELTGNDTISARNLYENGNEFKVTSKFITMLNKLPDIYSDDDGTWERLRVIHFSEKFIDNPLETDPHQHKKDPNLGEKIPTWKNAFMVILLEYYKVYKEKGIKEPKGILEETNKYRQRNNIFRQYIDLNLEEGDDSVSLDEIYSMFKMWYSEDFPNRKIPVKKELSNFLMCNFGDKFNGKKINNIQFKD